MEDLVITNVDGTRYITSRFNKIELTDNINIANVYKSNEILSPLVTGYSQLVGEQLKTDQLTKYYTPFNF